MMSVTSLLLSPYQKLTLQFTAETVHFGVDALSRRSLLLHVPNEPDGRLVVTSTRSCEGRLQGLEMQVLDGGQCGKINIRELGSRGEVRQDLLEP